MKLYRKQKYCRNCGCDKLKTILDLGFIYPSTFVDANSNVRKAPLVLVKCENCGLTQLNHTVNLDLMYRNYWYQSGLNDEMVGHLKDIFDNVNRITELKQGDVIVDIGANDGTLLDFYPDSLVKIAFEPSLVFSPILSKKCYHVITDYFDSSLYWYPSKAKVVTAIAVFYDLPNPNEFIRGVHSILDDDGIFVIQFSDLYDMIKYNDFSSICHEHLEYYDLEIAIKLLEQNGFSVFDVQRNKVNGGSLRILADKHKREKSKNIELELKKERDFFNKYSVIDFGVNIARFGVEIRSFIRKKLKEGKTFYILGAGTKGNTILQYYKLNNKLIKGAADINPAKWGLKTVGTNIPIMSDDDVFSKNPDYMIVLPWFFINNFITKYHEYIKNGGIFLVPLPEPALVTNQGWKDLNEVNLEGDYLWA